MVEDFKAYELIYNKQENKGKPILMFGNVLITKVEMMRIKSITSNYPYGIECMILMITDKGHECIDLKKEFPNFPVYIIPHLDS